MYANACQVQLARSESQSLVCSLPYEGKRRIKEEEWVGGRRREGNRERKGPFYAFYHVFSQLEKWARCSRFHRGAHALSSCVLTVSLWQCLSFSTTLWGRLGLAAPSCPGLPTFTLELAFVSHTPTLDSGVNTSMRGVKSGGRTTNLVLQSRCKCVCPFSRTPRQVWAIISAFERRKTLSHFPIGRRKRTGTRKAHERRPL